MGTEPFSSTITCRTASAGSIPRSSAICGDVHADEVLVALRVDVCDVPGLPLGRQAPEPGGDLIAHPGPDLGVLEAADEVLDGARLHPEGDELVESRARRGVGVHVVGDVQPALAGLDEHFDHLRAVAVHAPVGYGEVGELDRNPGAIADLNGLLDSRDVLAVPNAGVGGVEGAIVVA